MSELLNGTSSVANHLNKTIQDLGIDWSGIETLADLRTGLRVALAKMEQRIEG